jgi:hypothetical protein
MAAAVGMAKSAPIGQHAQPAVLDQHRGVAYEGDPERQGAVAWGLRGHERVENSTIRPTEVGR